MLLRFKPFLCLCVCLAALTLLGGCAGKKEKTEEQATSYGRFPETTSKTRVIADKIDYKVTLTPERIKFAAEKLAGTQKITVSTLRELRMYNPDFVSLHYHLAFFASDAQVLLDGHTWGSDFEPIKNNEDAFMHSGPDRQRVMDHVWGAYLMNITNEDWYIHLKNNVISQAKAAECDGVFLDSYNTSVIPYFTKNKYPEFEKTNARDFINEELGGLTWIQASERYMRRLTKDLNEAGLKCLPNIGNLITGWDNTDYSIADGGMAEQALDWQDQYTQNEWKMGMNSLLKLINMDKIIFIQAHLKSDTDYQGRLYRLGNYLLLRGKYTYITYYDTNEDVRFKYYPEFDVDVGAPVTSAKKDIEELKAGDLYVREFEKGIVVVNSHDTQAYSYEVPEGYKKVEVTGGGTVRFDGTINGYASYVDISGTVEVPAKSALILVRADSIEN